MTISLKPAIYAPTFAKGVRAPLSAHPQKSDSSGNGPAKTPDSRKPQGQVPNQRQQFAVAALNMSWQLAVVVLVPVLAGVRLDKWLGTSYICTFIGLGLALAGSGVVMWRAMQAANRLPVPKLTEEQRRAVRKSYQEEDDD